MIGRIQNTNVSVPLEATFESNFKKTPSSITDPEDRTARSSLGVASMQDVFEKVSQDDFFAKMGLGFGFLVDPTGYPGEEWLWQES